MKRSIAVCLITVLFSCSTKQEVQKPDVLAANLDSSVAPGTDFFLYANGGWIKKNPIPGEESNWGIGNLVVEENLKRLRLINEKAAAEQAPSGSTAQKIGDFWKTAMDTIAIEKNGLKPLESWFKQIDGIKTIQDASLLMAQLERIGVGTLVGSYITQDAKNSNAMAMQFWQTGIGLPEREYYFKNDSATIEIRKAYTSFIARTLSLSGIDTTISRQSAAGILKMETQLATVHRKLEDLRDPYANYNKMSVQQFYRLAPSLDLQTYLNKIGVTGLDSVIVGQPEYYKALEKILQTTPIQTIQQLLRFRLLYSLNVALPDIYNQELFQFRKLLTGAKERKPRWKRVIQNEESVMGELMGQLYVKEYFNETAKKRYSDLVEAIRTALKNRITKLDWMSDSTKQKAFAKLATMKKKVGYPDKWKDFSGMNITNESYIQNLINANTWWHDYELNKLGKPVNRDDWEMSPQTYNAYYNPSNNEIVLPAGIFTVPGYRDEELDDATVYGNAGASTIGHEITHGFDDEGRKFDEKGNLVSWWTIKDEEQFNLRAKAMVDQFNAYEPIPGYKINGKATLGENIADLGGVLLGWDAFKETEQYKKNQPIAGLTPAQRYFLGYALGWMGHIREEALKNQLLVDVHAPAKWRVNGPFVNVDGFYSAFSIQPGQALFVPEERRVKIW
ncbi:MAG: M13 family metallopeptidase [Lacibacter sp.]